MNDDISFGAALSITLLTVGTIIFDFVSIIMYPYKIEWYFWFVTAFFIFVLLCMLIVTIDQLNIPIVVLFLDIMFIAPGIILAIANPGKERLKNYITYAENVFREPDIREQEFVWEKVPGEKHSLIKISCKRGWWELTNDGLYKEFVTDDDAGDVVTCVHDPECDCAETFCQDRGCDPVNSPFAKLLSSNGVRFFSIKETHMGHTYDVSYQPLPGYYFGSSPIKGNCIFKKIGFGEKKDPAPISENFEFKQIAEVADGKIKPKAKTWGKILEAMHSTDCTCQFKMGNTEQ